MKKHYNKFIKFIKAVIMKYGLWKTSLAVSLPILVWQFANIIQAIAVLIGTLK